MFLLQGFQTSDLEQYDSLPYDDIAPSSVPTNQSKKVRKRHKPNGKERSVSSASVFSVFII